ncbi:tetratricopeptide repeat protein [Kiloniella spongiae]|uniref:tetratricopeptide repeat protein n=1 Tax=Kiloniella spongiae TaxID=1489064 RepID=UPI00069ACAAC|nr:tetratricopeptide repeat protein [Kiloniella spongiae]
MEQFLCLAFFLCSFVVGGLVQAADLDKGKSALIKGDYTTALTELRPLAEQGDRTAQYYLGVMYKEGQGVAVDDTLSHQWLTKSAENGDAQAQMMMGMMYHFGSGVEENMDTARKWYQLAADQGLEEAQTVLVIIAE